MLQTITDNWLERRQRKQRHHLASKMNSNVAKQLRLMRTAEEMIDWIRQSGIPPNVATYQTLVEGVTVEGSEGQKLGQAVFAHSLLDRILERVATDLQSIHNDNIDPLEYSDLSRTFLKVMSCYCRANDISSAQELLTRLEEWQEEHKNNEIFPVKDTNYTIVLNAWARAGRPREAEEVWRRMLKRASGSKEDSAILLRRIRYTLESLLNAWVTSCDRLAGQRAELLLVKMIELHDEARRSRTTVDTKPNITSFSKAVAAWANSRHNDAPQRADDLLRLMHDMDWTTEQAAAGNFQRTMASSYLIVMKMWSSSKDKRAPEKCRNLLLSLDGSLGLSNVEQITLQKMYAALIWAWARSGRPDAATNVQDIFLHMEKHREPGGLFATEGPFRWHADVHSALLRVYSRTGEGVKAETLLKRMMVEYINLERRGKRGLVNPMNTLNFNEVLLAWSKSRDKAEGARRAEKLFLQMTEGTDIKPDVVSYNALLSALSRSVNTETARRGERYFRQLQQKESTVGRPNSVTYTRAILLWSNIRTPEALDRAQALLAEMIASNDPSMQPDVKTYKAFLPILEKSEHLPDEVKRRRVKEIEQAMERLGYRKRADEKAKERRRNLLFRDVK